MGGRNRREFERNEREKIYDERQVVDSFVSIQTFETDKIGLNENE